ncbi:Protein of unknown function [Lactobacillus helveticus CIRM-BIA 953]|uniref:Uncharacterized protein n=1 Tax=Lactobacillus helveticus CIRM-BIA 953 TaxID=1226335 RepID=U4QBI4_LACHE|nr:Protein of unknown function [Lactobacillus helveticus CIRM-BIA 953]
MFQASRLF